MSVVIETSLGDLTIDLFVEERPLACLNFLKLCKLKYYNFNLFHNIEHDFIAQTGDPTGAGDGGESVWGVVEGFHKRYFEAESLPKIKHTIPGLVSMVSVGKNMVGSQFFFTLGSDLISLDGVHCVIGEVTEGHEVLRKLNEAIVDEKYRPYQDIRITHTVILEDPFDDPRGFQIPSRSPSPSAERLKNGRIGADEDIDDTEGKTAQEIQEMLQEREAKARAIILEIVGDLPDAEIAPPENVLFVCKLNPVTTDDDLEIIFSRFGKVKCCEVIRDKVTGDSLQYAFVEFEDKKSCENAYFKMDNVLIDDRRIHVDFSQSVAKVKWRGKGRGVVRSDGKDGGKLDFSNLRQSGHSNDRNRPPKVLREDTPSERRIRTERGGRRPRQQRSHSRSRSPKTNRSRSRSLEPRGRSKQDRRNTRSDATERSDRRSSSRSRNSYTRYSGAENRDQRRGRDYENRNREKFHHHAYHNRRQDRRSRTRSPHNSRSNRDRELSPNNNRSRHREYSSYQEDRSIMRQYDPRHEKSGDDRHQTNVSRNNRSNGNNRSKPDKREEHKPSKRKIVQSPPKKKRNKNVKKNESSLSSEDSESSESSSTSSEDEKVKKSKRKQSKSRSKKKSKKRKASSSSTSSSDSSSD